MMMSDLTDAVRQQFPIPPVHFVVSWCVVLVENSRFFVTI